MDVLQVSEILKDAEEARRQEIRSQEARGVAEIRGIWTGIDSQRNHGAGIFTYIDP